MDALRNQTRQIDEAIRELEDKAGSWDEEAIQKLKDEKKALEAEHQRKKNSSIRLMLHKHSTPDKSQINDLKLANRDIERQINKLASKCANPLEELQQEKNS